ncbi:MAG TPA: transglycosylase domain-containing protein, partial [Clostridia bacterium]|nr:transglycosylase domain-containing protein [Clostridia bacterium]
EHWQAFDPNKITSLKQTSRVYDMDGGFITALQGTENRTVVPLSEIPLHVRNAFLAAEDLRFYQHMGFDFVRFFGSVVANLKSRSFSQGFSTISQQLIKLTHLTTEKTLPRKAQEVFLALQLERHFTKDEILSLYLNYIYFGNRAYGIQEAARQYFHKDVGELTVAEGAALAATINATSYYAPHLHPENNKTRRDYVLTTMYENKMIDEPTYQAALSEELTVYTAELAPVPYGWFIDQVMEEAEAALGIGSDDLLGGGYSIYTTLSPDL